MLEWKILTSGLLFSVGTREGVRETVTCLEDIYQGNVFCFLEQARPGNTGHSKEGANGVCWVRSPASDMGDRSLQQKIQTRALWSQVRAQYGFAQRPLSRELAGSSMFIEPSKCPCGMSLHPSLCKGMTCSSLKPHQSWGRQVTRLEALKFRAKAGSMLEKIQIMFAQQQDDEEIPGMLRCKRNWRLRQILHVRINVFCCITEGFEDKEGNEMEKSLKWWETDKWPEISLCVCFISVKGNNIEGESERLHGPHQSPSEAAHGSGHQHQRGWSQSQLWWFAEVWERPDPSGVFQNAKPWHMARGPGQPSHLWCWWCGRPGEAFQGVSREVRIYLTLHWHMRKYYVCIFANWLALFNPADWGVTWLLSRMSGRAENPGLPQFKDKSYSGLWEIMLTKDPYKITR